VLCASSSLLLRSRFATCSIGSEEVAKEKQTGSDADNQLAICRQRSIPSRKAFIGKVEEHYIKTVFESFYENTKDYFSEFCGSILICGRF
jgi:hypothetical protein